MENDENLSEFKEPGGMKKLPKTIRKYGLIWIALSPILILMAGISTVKSETTYIIQFMCFGTVAMLGLVSGAASLFLKPWGGRVLEILSWVGLVYFAGSGLIIIFYIMKGGNYSPNLFLIGAGVICTGLPFLFLALRIRKNLNQQT